MIAHGKLFLMTHRFSVAMRFLLLFQYKPLYVAVVIQTLDNETTAAQRLVFVMENIFKEKKPRVKYGIRVVYIICVSFYRSPWRK